MCDEEDQNWQCVLFFRPRAIILLIISNQVQDGTFNVPNYFGFSTTLQN